MFTFEIKDPDKMFMTSDTHFSHFNITRYCHRPFQTRKEMNDSLIENWNSVVPKDGIVIHCGDFMLPHKSGTKEYEKIWKHLNFKTLILCRGNHDRIECGEYHYDDGRMVIVKDIAKIKVEDISIMACHYPMLAYPSDYQIFGHIHTLSDGTCHGIDGDVNKRLRKSQYDVGVDQNNYKPVSFWELADIFRLKQCQD